MLFAGLGVELIANEGRDVTSNCRLSETAKITGIHDIFTRKSQSQACETTLGDFEKEKCL